jgi:hypothetical protein
VLVKQMKGRDFYGCLAYVLGKAGARPLDSNMQADTPNELNHEFQVLDAGLSLCVEPPDRRAPQ